MRRRDFLSVAVGAAFASAMPARAQQAMPVVGFLHSGSANAFTEPVAAFEQGLKDGGFTAGRNVAIAYRWADLQPQRLAELAADLVRRNVSVIATGGGNLPPLAAKAATNTIPVVFITGADPVAAGLVASVSRPGANVTGVSFLVEELGEKLLALLHELLPAVTRVGVLINPRNPGATVQEADVRAAASKLGLQLEVGRTSTLAELYTAFSALVARGIGGLFMIPDPFFGTNIDQTIALAARHRIPTMYYRREFAEDGGLISYGTSADEAYGNAGEYVARILKGARPADLPVTQVVKFELVINLKTAKTLGLEIPPGLSARADAVIE